MPKKTGLGRGINALVAQTTEEVGIDTMDSSPIITELDITKIVRNESQPRQNFDEEEIDQLAESIKEVGIIQPIIVRYVHNSYEIIAGERRYRAAIRAGLTTVPVIIRESDDTNTLTIALIENIQRSDLNSIEIAKAYKEIINTTNITQEELAQKVGKSRPSITNHLRLLELPQDIQIMLENNEITNGHARALLSLSQESQQIDLAYKIIEKNYSVRQTEEAVKKILEKEKSSEIEKQKNSLPSVYKTIAQSIQQNIGYMTSIKKKGKEYSLEIMFSNEDDLSQLLTKLHID